MRSQWLLVSFKANNLHPFSVVPRIRKRQYWLHRLQHQQPNQQPCAMLSAVQPSWRRAEMLLYQILTPMVNLN
jgi:hypothetical protein